MTAKSAIIDTAASNGWDIADTSFYEDGTSLASVTLKRNGVRVWVSFTGRGSVSFASKGTDVIRTRDAGKREAVLVWLTDTDTAPVLANGTRVEFTRSHIDANGVTTRETHTGTIVGTRAPHPTAPRPRRSYDVIEDGHPADSWEATHPLTFLEDDITPVCADSDHEDVLRCESCGFIAFSESDSSTFSEAPADRYEWFLVDTADGELNLFRLSDMRNLNDAERLAVLCGYPGCDEPATASVTLPLPDHRRKDAAVCDTHEQGARFLADTLSEWVDEDSTREPAVSRLFPADSADSEPREWEQELLAQQDSEAIERDIEAARERDELEASVSRHPAGKRRRTMSAPADSYGAASRFVEWFNGLSDEARRTLHASANTDTGETVEHVAAMAWWDEADDTATDEHYDALTDLISMGIVEIGDDGRAYYRPSDSTAGVDAMHRAGERVENVVHSVAHKVGLAGQMSYTADVSYPHGDRLAVTFYGSAYGTPGPIIMEWVGSDGIKLSERVSEPSRFGESFGEDWVRAFFA